MNIQEFNKQKRKHFEIILNNEEIYDILKIYLKSYKNISLNHYETFKRVALLYYLCNINDEGQFLKDLKEYFNRVSLSGGKMDIVEEIVNGSRYETTYMFPLKCLNPVITNRVKFEKDLVAFFNVRENRY